MLYNCYELIKPDVAMEVGWRCGMQEFVMPYFIQFMRDMSTKVEGVQKNTEDIKKKEEAIQDPLLLVFCCLDVSIFVMATNHLLQDAQFTSLQREVFMMEED